jgi:hypothetical protein
MDEKSVWFGFSLGFIASGIVLAITIIDNNYIKSLPITQLTTVTNITKPIEIDFSVLAGFLVILGLAMIVIISTQLKPDVIDGDEI